MITLDDCCDDFDKYKRCQEAISEGTRLIKQDYKWFISAQQKFKAYNKARARAHVAKSYNLDTKITPHYNG